MDADEALAEYIKDLVKQDLVSYDFPAVVAREDRPPLADHMRSCADVKVLSPEGWNGTYGCDTGCDYARIAALISCPHRSEWLGVEYGWFGDMADIYDELDKIRREAST